MFLNKPPIKSYARQIKRKLVIPKRAPPIKLNLSSSVSESEVNGCKNVRKNKTKYVGRKRKKRISIVSKPLRLSHVSPKLVHVEPNHSLIFNDSLSFEESPFSKVAKTARKDLGLQFVSFDFCGSPDAFKGKKSDSSGCVSCSRDSSIRESSGLKSCHSSSQNSDSFVQPNGLLNGVPRTVTVRRKAVRRSPEMSLRDNSVECLSSETKSNHFKELSPRTTVESPTPPSLCSPIYGKAFRKSRLFLFTSTPVGGAHLRSSKGRGTCILVESKNKVPPSELFEDILSSEDKDSVEFASPPALAKFSSNELRPSSSASIDSFLCAAKEAVFRVCRQSCDVDFSSYVAGRSPAVLEKIGEGVFSEVFGCLDRQGTRSVWKVQPFEGDLIFNGEEQKKSADILSEIFITRSLSDLRSGEKLMTECFVKALDFKCVHCPFPEVLLDCWRAYDEKKGSENDCPTVFPDEQLMLITELEFAGVALEDFVFASAPQALSVFTQVAYALAVAELALEFEHRDLHWGNIMVCKTPAKDVTYVLDGEEITFSTRGVAAKIVDFTLSRATIDGRFHYADLAASPEIFESTGEYQFEVYRLMKKHTNNEWEAFKPYTNVLWLHYLILQMCKAVKYKNKKAQIHLTYMKKMYDIESKILEFSSALHYVSVQEYYP
ncbi:serine/threonine-protein kinase haspin-like [Ischnura elegans]|uniref:serine/threonine-protein kinase haspin-like n=1 Tax=Ischnura elegans TaxID=197161 RepID=UPI001ED8B958|nr:serine/threonine-protein kinase haspin-like [Ischnura elegans]